MGFFRAALMAGKRPKMRPVRRAVVKVMARICQETNGSNGVMRQSIKAKL